MSGESRACYGTRRRVKKASEHGTVKLGAGRRLGRQMKGEAMR